MKPVESVNRNPSAVGDPLPVLFLKRMRGEEEGRGKWGLSSSPYLVNGSVLIKFAPSHAFGGFAEMERRDATGLEGDGGREINAGALSLFHCCR